MSFCHQVLWSIQQRAQISPSLLFTAVYLHKLILLLSLATSSSTRTWFSKPHLCMFKPCLYIPSKSPVLSFNSSLHLACKLQQLLVHSCQLPLLAKIRSSRASPFTGSLIIGVWKLSHVLCYCVLLCHPSCRSQGDFLSQKYNIAQASAIVWTIDYYLCTFECCTWGARLHYH